MVKEVFSEIIYFDDYENKEAFEKAVEIEFQKVKRAYADCVVTKEFYKVNNILIRACKMERSRVQEEEEKEYMRQRDESYHNKGLEKGRDKGRERCR